MVAAEQPATAATKERVRIIMQHTAAKRARAAFPAGTPERAMYERLLYGKTEYHEAATALKRIAEAQAAAAAAAGRRTQQQQQQQQQGQSPAGSPAGHNPFSGLAIGRPSLGGKSGGSGGSGGGGGGGGHYYPGRNLDMRDDRGPDGTAPRWPKKPPKPTPRRRKKKHDTTWRPADEDVLLLRGEVDAAEEAWQRKRRRGMLAVRLLYVAGEEAARRLRALPPPPTPQYQDGKGASGGRGGGGGGGGGSGGDGGAGAPGLDKPSAAWHELLRLWPLIEQHWETLGEHDGALEELVGQDHGLPRARVRSATDAAAGKNAAAAAAAAADKELADLGDVANEDGDEAVDGWPTLKEKNQSRRKRRGETTFSQALRSGPVAGRDLLQGTRDVVTQTGAAMRDRWRTLETSARDAAPRLLRSSAHGGAWPLLPPSIGRYLRLPSAGLYRI
jgi:uncharacterized membrane protein YgcG